MTDALVIGAGPAGLMAADALSQAGRHVLVAEAKPSVARKFLMAGKSGLNLTKDEPFETCLRAFAEAAPMLRPMLEAFGAQDIIKWAHSLGQEMFTGSTGRVFPKVMKASPLLRAWLQKLVDQGVDIRTRWHWDGVEGTGSFRFTTPDGTQTLRPKVTVLACGGASWARLGSDGRWAEFLDQPLAPFQPANMGFRVAWSDYMRPYFGVPLKNIALTCGGQRLRGEAVVTNTGLEGGGIYAVSRAMREGHPLMIDLASDLEQAEVQKRIRKPRGKNSLSNHLRKVLGLSSVKRAMLMEFAKPLPDDLAEVIKALPIRHQGPNPMDDAISTAGGLKLDALDAGLMLRNMPGVFAAGEMLDWEAPTGGYLLTASMATGLWAGRHAARYS